MDTTFEQARQFFMQGLMHYEAGRFAQARAQFEASLALVPQRASTLTNLGATLLALGQFADAAVVLEEAVQIDPADAQTWGHLATVRAELGAHREALRCANEALARDATLAPVWTLKGTLLREMGQAEEARLAFAKAIGAGGDPQLNGYYLAALGAAPVPANPPRRYVESLFDGYAAGFDDHANHVLHYRIPAILANGLGDRRFDAALDLGCGTGLMGEALRDRASRIVGVDLSAGMVEQARKRGVYSEVVHADALEYLIACKERFDLVLAADVFIYVGELRALFVAIANAMVAGGVLAFTVELADDAQPLVLQPSLRYAHSRRYIESLAAESGFHVDSLAEHAMRDDQRTPVPGLFAWLRKP
jgi:predicted TPR repeat methyltransferase